jgi:hypothetical protein
MFSAETWALTKTNRRKIQATNMKYEMFEKFCGKSKKG